MRVFTKDEQRLLTRIRDGQGPNLYILIDPWINGVSFQVDTAIDSVDFIFETQGFNFDRLQEIQTIVIQSVNLLKLFEDKGYILTFINANQLPPNPFTFGQTAINVPTIPYHFPDPRISKMFCEYSVREIYVTPELNKFIKDGFITREEGRANRQWYTTMFALGVAIIALFLNIFIKSSVKQVTTKLKSTNQNSQPTSKITSDILIVSDTTVKNNNNRSQFKNKHNKKMSKTKNIQGIELLRFNHAGAMQLKDGRTTNYGVIRVNDKEVVYYTGKGLSEMWKPTMTEEEKKLAEKLKKIEEGEGGEQKLIASEHIAVTPLEKIVRIIF